MVKKNVVCITKKKKNDDNYVICFNKSNKKNKSKKSKKSKKDKKTKNKLKEDKYLKLINKAKSRKKYINKIINL